ncbi:MAG: ATP-dependent Clp protease adaptor ClpS, partial [Bacteroidota bacterium]
EHQGELSEIHELILYNDDVNSFDFVIDTLIEVCSHDPLQAEQIALVAHYKGKCAIKTGNFKILKSYGNKLSKLGLTITIE